ncbi:hypothetical protein TARUN_6905 [Trichoderma arundinaceum]|uniref:CST complex subunit Stn1 N-terminal domain-containing protein n=1 Tax=Trichoderma arundinaceum TaxID=490622 RepID=A0A395NGW6_TRIAR|nr:hypothetical protein TARUN_6905 [Trichoderma arundinaceum]
MPPTPAKSKDEATTGEQRTKTDAQAADAQEPDPYADVDVGMVVDVKGGVSAFRNERQINIEKMVVVKSTAQEVALWEKRTRFRREVLDVPWLLREKDVRRCRREAERSEVEKERKKRKVKQQSKAKEAKAKEAGQGDAKMATRATNNKPARAENMAERIQRIIQEGASSGKYGALGL